MDFLGYLDLIYQWVLHPPQWFMMSFIILWDMIRRFWPTFNPASMIHDIGNTLKKIGNLICAMGDLSDNLLPQNIKAPKKE